MGQSSDDTKTHVRVRGCEPAVDTVASDVLEATPMAISIPVATSEADASSPPNTSSPDNSKPPSTSPVNLRPKQSHPVRRRVQHAYLKDYHC